MHVVVFRRQEGLNEMRSKGKGGSRLCCEEVGNLKGSMGLLDVSFAISNVNIVGIFGMRMLCVEENIGSTVWNGRGNRGTR